MAFQTFLTQASEGRGYSLRFFLSYSIFFLLTASLALAAEAPRRFAIAPQPNDVIPTGNEWIALPEIRASDGALASFNALSMRYRGLLQVRGDQGAPALQPYFEADGKPVSFQNPSWDLIEYWIPSAHRTADGLEMTLTWCAPPGMRGAFLRMTVTNRRAKPVSVALGVKASWGELQRVTYTPVPLRGQRAVAAAPWLHSGEVFSYITNDTQFAWSLIHPGSTAQTIVPPAAPSPLVDARHVATLAPGATAEAVFVLGVGLEEFSAPHNAHELEMLIDRDGADAMLDRAAAWCRSRTRTTGRPDLDMLMNRNLLFTALYAWGRTIDTEQFVGVTSRSPRYYVSAAYWDRDAMLWSFPALLDIDAKLARDALQYAYTTQLRDTGTHSRFIDGVVLEDGFELDEAAAPLIALTEYVQRTGDVAFLRAHRDAVEMLLRRIESRHDAATGLYSTLQDAQDEYQKLPFSTYDNVVVWKALLDAGSLFDKLQDAAQARQMTDRAAALRKAILAHCVAANAPGAAGTIFVNATDGTSPSFADVPPGSLMKLPMLGFVPETDPVFERTYRWLHSAAYRYSYADQPYGLPGSYRLPFTTSWSVADHLSLKQGHAQAMKILLTSKWDGGIITEGVDSATAAAEPGGSAFATAAGYVADAICRMACVPPAP
ncbi:MAG: glycoside hydrolase family 125 protein [Acidobacteriota bacterium]